MAYYTRNLPHWFPEGRAIFLTWRLHGSLPASKSGRPEKGGELTAGEKFLLADKNLDRARRGPLWLKDPRIADSVVKTIRKGESELHHYLLIAFVIMPNHVHLLITPKVEVQRLTNGLKGVTARIANKLLHHSGQPFWQDESFDHWVRSDDELARIRSYIERNPVTAGLVTKPEGWPWSSAAFAQGPPR